MHQTLLELALPSPINPVTATATPCHAGPWTDPAARIGFEIGWDHARLGLVPPAPLAHTRNAISEGWSAGRAVFGTRPAGATRALRQWLALRLQAWQADAPIDPARLKPQQLAGIETPHCPVTRRVLGGNGDDAPTFLRLDARGEFDIGNLLVVSRLAAQAHAGLTAAQVLQRAERMALEQTSTLDGLDAAAWARLATLTSLVQPLPPVQAVRIPLRVLPPAHLSLRNPTQALQAVLTRGLQAPGFARRAASLAAHLPDTGMRHDFNVFVGALAARLLAIPVEADERQVRWAQEDAWADARLQRRWAQFALQLDAARCQTLLAQAVGWRAATPGRARRMTQAPGAGSTSSRPQISMMTSHRLATAPITSSTQPSVC